MSATMKKYLKYYAAVGAVYAGYNAYKFTDERDAKDIAVNLVAWPFELYKDISTASRTV